MPHFDIIRKVTPSESFRVKSIMGSYDMTEAHVEEHFVGNIELPEKWTIGLIVGRSGTGKTTIARELFGDHIITNFEYSHESVLDDMPQEASVTEICQALTSVGFASPPSWLKPYSVLSNGEKMRCDLARAILEKRDLFVFDEFTSVVDRNVAQIGSYAMQKALRKKEANGRKFIAVTCHADVEEWLMPDWVFNTDTMTFSTSNLDERKKNRPALKLEIFETKRKREYWEMFRKYHYLNHDLNTAAHVYVCYVNDQLAAFSSILPQPHPIRKHIWRLHRTVVFPDYQGVGIATALRVAIAEDFKKRGITVITNTSNRAMIGSMVKDIRWKCTSIGRKQCRTGEISLPHQSGKRITASFEYVGKK